MRRWRDSNFISFFTTSIYFAAARSSQCIMNVSSRRLILKQILWLWTWWICPKIWQLVHRKISMVCSACNFSRHETLLDILLANVPITANQQQTRKMPYENVGTQEMDTNGYQASNLKDIEFHLEGPDLNMATVIQPRIDSFISSLLSTILRWVHWLKVWFCLTRRKKKRTLLIHNNSLWATEWFSQVAESFN